MNNVTMVKNSNILVHHGIKGQRWGVRRFQNEDGSLTAAGKKKNNKEKSNTGKKVAAGIAIGSAVGLSALGISMAITRGKNYVKKSPFCLSKLSEVKPRDLDEILKELGVTGSADDVVLKIPLAKGGFKTI